jgi:hypothetical protein
MIFIAEFMIKLICKALISIIFKIAFNAIAEKELANLLFTLAQHFADKTENKTDDKIVAWAKNLYDNSDQVQDEVNQVVNKIM